METNEKIVEFVELIRKKIDKPIVSRPQLLKIVTIILTELGNIPFDKVMELVWTFKTDDKWFQTDGTNIDRAKKILTVSSNRIRFQTKPKNS